MQSCVEVAVEATADDNEVMASERELGNICG